jgi:dCMP deaminase
MRPTRDELFMEIAEIMSQRATCQRAQVGCIITSSDHRIISSGYNGTLIGNPHCTELHCDLTKKCQHSVHAEANAIAFAARYGTRLEGATLFNTTCPCLECAKLVVQAGIIRVVYKTAYETDNGGGWDLMFKNNIQILHFE